MKLAIVAVAAALATYVALGVFIVVGVMDGVRRWPIEYSARVAIYWAPMFYEISRQSEWPK